MMQSNSCGMMNSGQQQVLSLPLQTLKDEHIPLRKLMDELVKEANAIVSDEPGDQLTKNLGYLRGKVLNFVEKLDPHSEIEEGVLFQLLGNYIGRETGPIAVMEYEHDQAKLHLKRFLDKTVEIKQEDYIEVTSNVIKAYHILVDHFMKEENVLFPLAERTLSIEELEFLQEKMTLAVK